MLLRCAFHKKLDPVYSFMDSGKLLKVQTFINNFRGEGSLERQHWGTLSSPPGHLEVPWKVRDEKAGSLVVVMALTILMPMTRAFSKQDDDTQIISSDASVEQLDGCGSRVYATAAVRATTSSATQMDVAFSVPPLSIPYRCSIPAGGYSEAPGELIES